MSIANLNLKLLSQTIESEGKSMSKIRMKQLLMSLFFMGDGEPPSPSHTVKGLSQERRHTAQGTAGDSQVYS